MRIKRITIFIAMISVMLLPGAGLLAQTGTVATSSGSQSSGESQGSKGQKDAGSTAEAGQQEPSETYEVPHLMDAKQFGPGWIGEAPSYFIPSFQWTTFVNSNSGYSSNNQNPLYQGTAVVNLTLQRVSRNSQFNLNYAGGTEFYNQSEYSTTTSSANSHESTFHQLSIGESVIGRRWSLIVDDNASYLPESPGAFSGFGGLQSFNSGLGGAVFSTAGNVNPILQPDQSILTFGRRVSNTSIGEVQYAISPRTSVNFTGSYGILRFIDSGFNDENYTYLLAGFTHVLGPRDYIGLNYQESLTHFNPDGQNLRGHGVLFSYGHRFLGRLSFEVSGGPSLSQFTNPVVTSSSSSSSSVSPSVIQFANLPEGSSSQILWNTFGSLQYRLQETDFGVSFGHSTTGGSGVLLGAETNHADVRIGQTLFRTTFLGLNLGYNQNHSLSYANTGADQAVSKGWEGGINLSRELGRHLSLYIQYNIQRQTSNSSFCVASRCGETFIQQTGGIGLNWHTRPIRLQ